MYLVYLAEFYCYISENPPVKKYLLEVLRGMLFSTSSVVPCLFLW